LVDRGASGTAGHDLRDLPLAFNLGTTIAPFIAVALIAGLVHLLFWAEAVTACAYAVIAAVALPVARSCGPRGRRQGRQRRRIGYRALLMDRPPALPRVMFRVLAAYVQFV